METAFHRREFLLSSGTAATASIAGCAMLSPGESDGQQDASSVAVVSQHRLATEAGLDVLADGGTAADAAVAVACTLSVVEPWFSSALGGGTWALYYDSQTSDVTSVDGVGPVGSDATPADFETRAGTAGIHQAIVPGAWDGWMLWLDQYGRLELDAVLEPAITLAREGYAVSPRMETWLDRDESEIADNPAAASIYMPDGELLADGETVYQHEMASTFDSLVEAFEEHRDESRTAAIQAARDYFYRGPLAEAIVAFSEEYGGYLTLADFHDFEAELVEPLSIEYDETIDVYQNPPNSQGITQLLALNILKEYDLSEFDPDDADAVHLQVEAIKLAFADRYHHVGDPDRVAIPIGELLDDEYARRQRERIDMDTAAEWPIESGLSLATDADHTTTFHIVDSEGNAAAVTTSLGAQFRVIGETGIHINNRMRMLALADGNPNQLTPGYKVRHTSNPFMALREGRPYILGGTTGVDTQPQGQTQQFLNVVEFELNAQDAVSRPRFVSSGFPSTQYPYEVANQLELEAEFPAATVQELRERDHDTVEAGAVGTANMLVVEDDGEALQVGAEPRVASAYGAVVQVNPD